MDPQASTSKDNANPIIHAQLQENDLRAASAADGGFGDETEWWRDSGMMPASGSGSAWAGDSAAGEEAQWRELLAAPVTASTLTAPAAPAADGKAPASTELTAEEIDQQEIFDLVRSVSDPEHPLTLEQLAVVNPKHITITTPKPDSGQGYPHVLLEFTPTIPHCSMSTLIGLSLRVRLMRALPPRWKLDIRVRPGTHQSENSVNKQLNDKERVAAALENQHLLEVVMQALSTAHKRGRAAAEAAGADGDDEAKRQVEQDLGLMVGDSAMEQAEQLARQLGVTV